MEKTNKPVQNVNRIVFTVMSACGRVVYAEHVIAFKSNAFSNINCIVCELVRTSANRQPLFFLSKKTWFHQPQKNIVCVCVCFFPLHFALQMRANDYLFFVNFLDLYHVLSVWDQITHFRGKKKLAWTGRFDSSVLSKNKFMSERCWSKRHVSSPIKYKICQTVWKESMWRVCGVALLIAQNSNVNLSINSCHWSAFIFEMTCI